MQDGLQHIQEYASKEPKQTAEETVQKLFTAIENKQPENIKAYLRHLDYDHDPSSLRKNNENLLQAAVATCDTPTIKAILENAGKAQIRKMAREKATPILYTLFSKCDSSAMTAFMEAMPPRLVENKLVRALTSTKNTNKTPLQAATERSAEEGTSVLNAYLSAVSDETLYKILDAKTPKQETRHLAFLAEHCKNEITRPLLERALTQPNQNYYASFLSQLTKAGNNALVTWFIEQLSSDELYRALMDSLSSTQTILQKMAKNPEIKPETIQKIQERLNAKQWTSVNQTTTTADTDPIDLVSEENEDKKRAFKRPSNLQEAVAAAKQGNAFPLLNMLKTEKIKPHAVVNPQAGEQLIHLAAKHNLTALARSLLAKGVDPHTETASGQKPFEIAGNNNSFDVVQILYQRLKPASTQ